MLRGREYGLEEWFPNCLLRSQRSLLGPSRGARGEEGPSAPMPMSLRGAQIPSVLVC